MQEVLTELSKGNHHHLGHKVFQLLLESGTGLESVALSQAQGFLRAS